MIDSLKVWVTNIAIAIFFITAVEMILPDNSIKKYAKFVLGIMLIVVIINPIMKIFDKNFNLDSYSSKATSYMESSASKTDNEKYKNINILNTTQNFKKNLEDECIANLKEAYPENKYNADIKIVYDSKNGTYNINTLEIGVVDEGVTSVKNIQINTTSVSTSNREILQNEQGNKIKKLLSTKLKISNNVITVYKLNS